MLFSQSLRLRLLILILTPLVIVAAGAIGWQYRQSAESAEVIFDQKLSIVALAIFRDLRATNGERLSPVTKAFFEEASGSPFFYHVLGPDGSFVTGYSPPPLNPKILNGRKLPLGFNVPLESEVIDIVPNQLVFFVSSHRGRPVKVVQVKERAMIDELSGDVVISVWQDLRQRQQFATHLLLRGVMIAGLLVLTTTLVVFFGIRLGLRPLRSLELAIAQRSSSDMGPIKRQVPREISHIVHRLNALFAAVTKTQAEKDRFISNAAHQLRNPIAGIKLLAEVTQASKSLKDAKERNAELLIASNKLARLTEQLLSYEALQQAKTKFELLELDKTLKAIVTTFAAPIIAADIEFAFDPRCGDEIASLDRMLLEQAISNLIDNALKHGGPDLKHFIVKTRKRADGLEISVCNDGAKIPKALITRIFERFEQGAEGVGSGLGLAIVREICWRHGGDVYFCEQNKMRCFVIRLPMVKSIAQNR